MKKSFLLLFSLVLLVSCKNESGENERILADSSGNINQLTVVMENNLWEGEVGEVVRNHLAAPVDGLPQEEPMFSLSQIPPQAFSGFVRKNRLFLHVEKGAERAFGVIREEYAKPQTGVVVKGQTNEELINIISENSDSIVDILKKTELKEKQRRISKSLKNDEILEEKLGVSLKLPTAYRYAMNEEDFLWIRKEIPKGLMEILVYEVPLGTIENDTNVIGSIIKMRDSIGEKYIPGPVEGTYMQTEEAYAPYLFESSIDGHFAYETRGTWDVKNAFMAGPFVNYAIRDEENNRYVILEGFVFSPSMAKRDNMFELDAILRSAKID
ncbi:DUF4837 family protein [Autumnicola edwardsiae]|jgi:hypothetical protein|uniref:DUF4837 family protein n=1 Tax=Autumnicola edwardsiae TaxID=3075594 RepID=A0ABU3CSM5_9FLAO|nr:DUF4837 family protein [Zunongwangia sp. F297]MDT0649301.1 DUF4837 family protein [Zunongwangia sp. F297]